MRAPASKITTDRLARVAWERLQAARARIPEKGGLESAPPDVQREFHDAREEWLIVGSAMGRPDKFSDAFEAIDEATGTDGGAS